MSGNETSIEITSDYVDQRLDFVLANALSLSRSQARALLKARQVVLNDHVQRLSDKGRCLAQNDRVVIYGFTDPKRLVPLANPSIPLHVLTEGQDYLIVEKPAGMPVHPMKRDETETVLNTVIARYPQIAGIGEGSLRCGVVHRLDTETSGALAFALSESRFQSMRLAFSEHQTRKVYRAVVAGLLKGRGEEMLNLVVAQHSPARVAVTHDPNQPGARRCTLEWQTLKQGKDRTLVEIQLHTGFLHQIRATFAARGFPVVGDARYGGTAADVGRMMLHAMTLEVDGVQATSPMPLEFDQALMSGT